MKKAIVIMVTALLALGLTAAETPRWLRQNAISPDGKTIAFVYQGDIFLVPTTGGAARQLTTNPAHDTEPLWSPDGKTIVFASYREGQKDIWAVPATGGKPKRLTDYGGAETPMAVSPDGNIYYSAYYQENPVSSAFPGDAQLYRLPLAEALASDKPLKPVPVLSLEVGAVSVNADGTLLYEDVKGYEDPWRKHHTSAVTRDIWKVEGGVYTKLSDFIGEDRCPVFAPGGNGYYFLSERGEKPVEVNGWAGDSNIWKASLSGGAPQRITSFKDNPVRYLSISGDGILCFSWNGDLYTLKEGGSPVKIPITVEKDSNLKEHTYKVTSSGITGFAASPGGKEVAVVSRGDVYVTPIETSDTRRITDTPGQERTVVFGKDGRTLYYDSERDGEWAVYKATIADKSDKLFSFAGKIKEERITPEGQVCFQPSVSPDGKWVGYLRNRTAIVIQPASGGKEKVLLAEGINYSYSDGDLDFEWSPDSKYILANYQGGGRMYNDDIALIEVDSGELTDLTESGYGDVNFKWALGGKAMTWESDKAGYRSHGSWGSEGDIYAMFFDEEAYMKFTRGKDLDSIDKLLSEEKKTAKKDTAGKDSAKVAKADKVKLVLEGRRDRIVRLTPVSGGIGDYWLNPEGDKLYYTVLLEKSRDLVCLNRKDGSVKVLKKKFNGRFVPSPDGKNLFVVESSKVSKVDLKDFSTKAVEFSGEFEYFPDKERAYIFEHCWRQVKEKWYDPQMHGVDWAAVGGNYRQFLPYITDNFAFRELLSEMLGELNGSHTGGRYRHGLNGNVGHIGVIFDEEYTGEGLKVKELLPGSLLSQHLPGVREGDVILAVDGKDIPAGESWYHALARTAGKRISLKVKSGGKEKNVLLTPGRSDSDALYQRWVRLNEKKVEELSGGKVGYVHVKGMNSPSFREVYSRALGKYRGCDALIVDTRHNGGGWLHNDLATFLDGKLYTERKPRDVYMAPEPYDKWVKPSCVLVCEDNYSDACGFPYVYRALGTGKIIGAPIPGTATSVWWETQVDPTLIFGIPQIGSYSIANGRYLENLQLEPDILVYNDPAGVARGEDKQLEAAVAEMLKTGR